MRTAILLRKIGGKFVACFRNGTALTSGMPRLSTPSMFAALGVFLAVLLVPMLLLAATVLMLSGHHEGALLAFPAAVALPAGIKKKKDDLDKMLTELETGQKEMAAGPITKQRGEELEAKAQEAAVLQDELDQYNRIAGITTKGRQVDNPLLPATKAEEKDENEVVAYMSLGAAFVNSPEYKAFQAQGFPAAREIVAPFNASFHHAKFGHGLVPITRKMLESKAVPTVGAGVIRADRETDIVRFAELQRLTIRDLLNVSPTTSNSIEYVTIATSTRAAAPVAESAVKPEAALSFGTGTAPVRTIAVTMPVTEQQLQDVPNLQNTIDNELSWDLKKTEEEQLVWGLGTGQNLLGIMNTPGVTAGRTVAGDTFIDLARRMISDIVISGLEPNGIIMDPLDWESVLLTKSTTNEYIWTVVTDDNGHRLWATRVVETVAAREPGTFTTNERRMIVGDFRRGATLWDRQQAGMQIGWINDQFTRNQRTIRVEERLAFGVKRPAAFKYRITQARVP